MLVSVGRKIKIPRLLLHGAETRATLKFIHPIVSHIPTSCSVLMVDSLFPPPASCNIVGVLVEKNSSWQQHSTQKVDVVFVSSEGQGMQSVVTLLPDFVKNLDKHLRKHHNLLPQFGLVGFSGKAPVHSPGHVHTIKGRFLGDAEDFTLKMLDNMEFAVR